MSTENASAPSAPKRLTLVSAPPAEPDWESLPLWLLGKEAAALVGKTPKQWSAYASHHGLPRNTRSVLGTNHAEYSRDVVQAAWWAIHRRGVVAGDVGGKSQSVSVTLIRTEIQKATALSASQQETIQAQVAVIAQQQETLAQMARQLQEEREARQKAEAQTARKSLWGRLFSR